MKELFGNLGNNPKFNTLVKLAFYSLFVFIAIIIINSSNINEIQNEVDNNIDESQEKILVELPTNYEYSYSINLDDKIYSYQGIVSEDNTFKKNKDNKITYYKYENNKYYKLINEKYTEVSLDEVYDIVDYDYLNVEKINQYLSNARKQEGKYYTYLKDSVTGEETDVYIEIIKEDNRITLDYSKLNDDYNKFTVILEYKERKVEGLNGEEEK